jgi:hypothetical protein
MASLCVAAIQYAAYRSLEAEPRCLGFSSCHWHRHPERFAPAMSSHLDSSAAEAGRLGGGSGGIGGGGGSGGIGGGGGSGGIGGRC